ncbi:MAG: hypothetical protein JW807_01590 [Spirochaetes bacterium]|nr:hypothetical protein [Spirochaetota bacterium]
MRISAGIAEINVNNPAAPERASERFYVWPAYNAGRVQQVRGLTRRPEPEILYIKPSPEERDSILGMSKERSHHEYLPTGRIGRTAPYIRPGSLFEALA